MHLLNYNNVKGENVSYTTTEFKSQSNFGNDKNTKKNSSLGIFDKNISNKKKKPVAKLHHNFTPSLAATIPYVESTSKNNAILLEMGFNKTVS